MKIRTIALASCIAAALPAAAENCAQTVDNAWKKAMAANDLEALVKLYAKDAVAWFPNMPEAKGIDAIRATYKGLLDANTVKAVSFTDMAYEQHGKVSLAHGHFSLTLQPKAGGAEQVMTGRFSEVVEKRGKDCVYVVDHASGDPPPPPKAAPAPAAAKPAAKSTPAGK